MNAEEFLKRYELGERDFSKIVLRGVQLNHLDLSDINLSQAWLESTCLMATNLSDANLSGANLRFCYLGSANLTNANLSHSQIEVTNFNESNLTNVDLTKTLLCDSSLIRTNLTGATIHECNLTGSFCRQAIFTDANWDWNYADAIFHETILSNTVADFDISTIVEEIDSHRWWFTLPTFFNWWLSWRPRVINEICFPNFFRAVRGHSDWFLFTARFLRKPSSVSVGS